MRYLIFLLIFLLFLPSVLGFETINQCLNDSYLYTIIQWSVCDGSSCSNYNISQTTNCTNGCDTNLNQCKYELKSDISYVSIPIVLTFVTGMFFFLGVKVQPGKEFSLFKNGIQTLFFFLGLWFIILDMGAISAIGMMSGISLGMSNLIDTGIVVITYSIYFVMILFIVSYLVVALMMMIPKKRKPFSGG